jgi:hypothetical protein
VPGHRLLSLWPTAEGELAEGGIVYAQPQAVFLWLTADAVVACKIVTTVLCTHSVIIAPPTTTSSVYCDTKSAASWCSDVLF